MIPPPSLPAGLQCGLLPYRAEVAAEAQLRAWLGERLDRAPADIAIARDARGRPWLDDARIDVSWSHSGDALLVALGRGLRVGVDIERVRPRPRALRLAERFFAAEESSWLRALPPGAQERAFLRLWCAKEAVLKAHGHGLSFGLHKLVFSGTRAALRLLRCDAALGAPAAWSLREWAPAEGYLAALAWRAAPMQGDGARPEVTAIAG
jgi:4'-phosphopantetheinyl transferase